MNKLTSFLLLIFSFCQSTSEPELTLISGPQTVEMVKAGNFNYAYAVFKNEDGSELTDDDRALLNKGLLAKDYYADENGLIKEVRVRPIQLADKFIDIQRRVLSSNPIAHIELLDVDCDLISDLMEEIDWKDQQVRNEGGDMELVDEQNQQMVISILSKCGWSEEYLHTIWLVFQHSPIEIMVYYYPTLKAYVNDGYLSKSSIALMEDRILMYNGYKQIYGSQISNGGLYDLEDPDNVNARRAEIGLNSIEEYIANWDLNFEEEKAKMLSQ
jgi:hypothetical protein